MVSLNDNVTFKKQIFNSGIFEASHIALKYKLSLIFKNPLDFEYSDVILSIKDLKDHFKIDKALIIDIDPNQSINLEKDLKRFFTNQIKSVYLIDAFDKKSPINKSLYSLIDIIINTKNISEFELIEKLKFFMTEAINVFKPDIIFYNTGNRKNTFRIDSEIKKIAIAKSISIVMELNINYDSFEALKLAKI
jgi:hypothetical protein